MKESTIISIWATLVDNDDTLNIYQLVFFAISQLVSMEEKINATISEACEKCNTWYYINKDRPSSYEIMPETDEAPYLNSHS